MGGTTRGTKPGHTVKQTTLDREGRNLYAGVKFGNV